MLTSLALCLLFGMGCAALAAELRLPRLVGMLATGVVLGPYVLGLLAPELLAISPDLRQLALVIILLRAGLTLDVRDLKKVGCPAVLMCFVPACFEIAGTMLLAPRLFGISLAEAALLGAVLGAVSPAVIIPKMIALMEEGYGKRKSIPQLVLAGAAVDDVFVIVLFTVFLQLNEGGGVQALALAAIPAQIVTGLVAGGLVGAGFGLLFRRVHMRDSVKVVLLLATACLLVAAEEWFFFPFSGLLAVMAMGICVQALRRVAAGRLSAKFSKLWVAAEVLLFVLVGAEVDIRYAAAAGGLALLLVAGALCFRAAGVWLCFVKTPLKPRERLFCVMAYLPKATVQAAIGPIPLALGLASGRLTLTVAVLAILVTAPLGSILIDLFARRLLCEDYIAPAEG